MKIELSLKEMQVIFIMNEKLAEIGLDWLMFTDAHHSEALTNCVTFIHDINKQNKRKEKN